MPWITGKEDDGLKEAKSKLRRAKLTLWLVPVGYILPALQDRRIGNRLTLKNWREEVQQAKDNIDWVLYDRTCPKRPLYPRKSALSSSNLTFKPHVQQRLDQLQSLFFRLPAELRNPIYMMFLGGHTVQLFVREGGKGGPKGSEGRPVLWDNVTAEEQYDHLSMVIWNNRWNDPTDYSWLRGASWPCSRNIVAFLQTCRRV